MITRLEFEFAYNDITVQHVKTTPSQAHWDTTACTIIYVYSFRLSNCQWDRLAAVG